MRSKRIILCSLLISLITIPIIHGQAESFHFANDNANNELVLTRNKKEMLHNDKTILASQPFIQRNGISYVALNGIAQPYGYKVSYDALRKESIAATGSFELRFKSGSRTVSVNGSDLIGPAPTLTVNGSLMIPLRLWTELTASRITSKGMETTLRWSSSSPTTRLPAPLRVSDNGRAVVTTDGVPFFWLADTAWELVQRLNRSEIEAYLKSTAEQRFNVIQVTALTHFWDGNIPNTQGDLPLEGVDPNKPLTTPGNDPSNPAQYDYWDHLDYVIDTAASLGIYVALLPTWGKYIIDNSGSPFDQPYQGIFDQTKSYAFGKWIGSRYANKSNIIWVLGGDRAPDTESKRELIRRMAQGIHDGGGTQLTTFHPIGGRSSSEWFQNESWLDFNMYQSGHVAADYPNYKVIASDYAESTVKPVLDAEPRYENSGINFSSTNGRFTPYDVRQAAYWSVFAGSFGHSYGHGALWQMYAPGRKADEIVYWYDALNALGRTQMKHLRKLMESRPLLERVPDQSLVVDTLSGGQHIRATRGSNYAMVYVPKGSAFSIQMGKISGDTVKAYWYNPRTGVSTLIGELENKGTREFIPPSNGNGNDWILLIDDPSAGFPIP